MIGCAVGGLGERSRGGVHIPHVTSPHQIRVTHVRHPCDWLRSYYTTVAGTYLDVPCVDVFRNLNYDSFHKFVKSYLRLMPGAIGAMFDNYHADTFIRLEDEPIGLVSLLKSTGCKFNRAKVLSLTTPANKSAEKLPVWTDNLYRSVLEAEKTFVEAFDYGSSRA